MVSKWSLEKITFSYRENADDRNAEALKSVAFTGGPGVEELPALYRHAPVATGPKDRP